VKLIKVEGRWPAKGDTSPSTWLGKCQARTSLSWGEVCPERPEKVKMHRIPPNIRMGKNCFGRESGSSEENLVLKIPVETKMPSFKEPYGKCRKKAVRPA
jgi:hypothetical protein